MYTHLYINIFIHPYSFHATLVGGHREGFPRVGPTTTSHAFFVLSVGGSVPICAAHLCPASAVAVCSHRVPFLASKCCRCHPARALIWLVSRPTCSETCLAGWPGRRA